MKRSKSISLAVMGLSAFSMTACEDPVEAAVYESVEQCISDSAFSAEQCQSEFDRAAGQHSNVAPRYSSLSDCEADFGRTHCGQRTTGSGYIPFMAGYMMGTVTSGGRVSTQPLYRAADDSRNFRTASNSRISGVTGVTTVDARSTSTPRVRTTTVSRGGFGARAARSSGG